MCDCGIFDCFHRYLIHSVLDTSLGILINFGLIRFLEMFGSNRFSAFDSGYYGHPPSAILWLKQLCVWFTVVSLSKLVVIIVVIIDQLGSKSHLETFAEYILIPFRSHAKLQLVVIMLVIPFILNVIMFWVQDNFLKKTFKHATASWITYASLESVAALDLS
eukprot:c1855_g1_i1.p1 GENE.c1855_g1_i1~~c1855_g1_i1.p1  ORF type:complete len:162 (+),score=23.03 c1855_g1_i1:405-890(+)